jgi:basic membrane protein A
VVKLYTVAAVLLALHVALSFVQPAGSAAAASTGVKVGVVFDIGGLGDKSFNDAAYEGANRAAKQLGAHVQFVEPAENADREAGMRLLAAEGMDLVIGVGFAFTDDLRALATEYPAIPFAGVDYAVGDGEQLPTNLVALKFREEHGSFLVGALAALVGQSKKVGFVGGMDIPLIHKFEAGYKAGVKHVCADCEVIAQYAGTTPDAFANPKRGAELATSQYEQDVNVIYHASGSTGLGVFEAARKLNQRPNGPRKLAIGVDSDQYASAPGIVLSSMVKRVDNAVYDSIQRVRDHKFAGGLQQFGLAEEGVGYVYDDHNKALIPDAVRAKLESLKQDIIAGKIAVPSTR